MILREVHVAYDSDVDTGELWFDKMNRLSMLVSCVGEWVSCTMEKTRDIPYGRLNVVCWNGEEFKPGPFFYSGVCEIRVPLDLTPILLADDREVKKTALKALREGVSYLSKVTGDDLSAVLEACRALEERDYDTRWEWKRVRSRGGNVARVEVNYDPSCFSIELVVSDRYGHEKCREVVMQCAPGIPFMHRRYMKSLKWVAPDIVALGGADGFRFTLNCDW